MANRRGKRKVPVEGDFPPIKELKRTYFGETKAFDCLLLESGAEEAILLYQPRDPVSFLGIEFDPACLSSGFYWVHRNYNVYHWVAGSGSPLLDYFNICRERESRRIESNGSTS
jgi:hypothetical protein